MNIYLINSLTFLLSIIFGYLLGSIPNGVIIGKLFYKKDPRHYYSHNSGGTNSGRVLGKKIGVLVTILDMLKAILSLYVVWAILEFAGIKDYFIWQGYDARPLFYYGSSFFSIVGHCYPIYLKFKGGKGVASTLGANGSISPVLFSCDLMFFIYLYERKIVSLSSMLTSVTISITTWVIAICCYCLSYPSINLTWSFGFINFPTIGFELAVMNTLITLLIIYRHKENIKRIKQGNENKVSWLK